MTARKEGPLYRSVVPGVTGEVCPARYQIATSELRIALPHAGEVLISISGFWPWESFIKEF